MLIQFYAVAFWLATADNEKNTAYIKKKALQETTAYNEVTTMYNKYLM